MYTVPLKMCQETISLTQVLFLSGRLGDDAQKKRNKTGLKGNSKFRLEHFTGEGRLVLRFSYQQQSNFK